MTSDEQEERRASIQGKLEQYFPGRFVRKDLTQRIKEGANVPTYVLEFLLGQYANGSDDVAIERGVENVKKTLANNYVRPDEAEKIKSKIRENGAYTVIDKLTVSLNTDEDRYEASFGNLGIDGVPVEESYPQEYERLLIGGIWSIVRLSYDHESDDHFHIEELTPIQVPFVDMDEVYTGRKAFSTDEWIDLLLRSMGMEPDAFDQRVKWLLISRLIPLVENNYNMVELGPRGTGKSHVYKELSPNTILVSGGQTTVANLFYNMARHEVGLVGMWDVVAFDEVAGINFKDQDGIQIMKDYMASSSFVRGRAEIQARAGMVFVGNINQSVDVLLRTSNLFEPFPEVMGTDTAFLDRIHNYMPGWEIPKYKPSFFTGGFGFITDYLAEVMRELRKTGYGDVIEEHFNLGAQLNQRDAIAVRKTVSGMIKLLFPDGEFSKGDLEDVLVFALEMRRRVKEQLKKIGGMEFYDVNFSYIDRETGEEKFVTVPEQGSATLIPSGTEKPGYVYTIQFDDAERLSLFKLESQQMPGTGKLDKAGIGSNRAAREAMETAMRRLVTHYTEIDQRIMPKKHNYVVQVSNLNGSGSSDKIALATYISLISLAVGRPTLDSMVVLGDMTVGGDLIKLQSLADTLQVAKDSGAKSVLLPSSAMAKMGEVPPDLFGAFTWVTYQSVEDAAFKAFGLG